MDLLVADRIEIAEAQIFQFAANFPHAQPVRDGSVNVQGLLCDFLLPFGWKMLQGAHVVQTVGQLDEHHANVINHGQHHLAQVFRLLFLAGGEIDFADFGDALDDAGHLVAEFFADVDDGDRGVFDRIVQQPGGDTDRVHLHFRQHAGNFQGVNQVGLAGGASLSGVIFLGILVRLADDFQGVVGPVGLQLLHQVTETRDGEDVGCDLLAQSPHTRL